MDKEIVDYSKVCFVIMPFGNKVINIPITKKIFCFSITRNKKVKIDFDYIYKEIFAPAISKIDLPEGGKLIPKRADDEFYSGSISKTMFEFIEYSRMTLADITGLNANVFYELGARHDSNPTGTAIFRLSDSIIPFDISQMRAFPYKYNPIEEIDKSKELIKEVIQNTLKYSQIDSPIYLSLQRQQSNTSIELLLIEAENALRSNDRSKVLEIYDKILNIEPNNPNIRMKKGLIYKKNGEWEKALCEFDCVTKILKEYADGYREKGIAENKLYEKNKGKYIVDGVDSLEKAIKLNSRDYDAYSSLGGILKRKGEWKESIKMYEKAMRLSLGNPYPLLNYIKLVCRVEGKINISDELKVMINMAKEYSESQIEGVIPCNAPWSFFDLAETYAILEKDESKIKEIIEKGVYYVTSLWQIETFKNSLELLSGSDNVPKGYKVIINYLEDILTKKNEK